ncbi:MAG: hypothetical protein ACLT5P_16555 [Flavonifractor plautii]
MDFFSPAHPKPVRVEFFGDEIDAMGLFDPDTQRRIENLGAAEILPAAGAAPVYPWRVRRAAGGAGPSHFPGKAPQGERDTGADAGGGPGAAVGQHGLPGHGPLHRPDLPRHGHGGGLLPRGRGGGAQREPPGGRAGKELPVAVGRGRQGPDGAGRAGRGAG